jgi:bacteriorhodopsin
MLLALQVFFGSWLLFPILFLMGPEGFGHLSPWGSIIAHTFADLLSKNLWGLLAHHLRNKVRLQAAGCSLTLADNTTVVLSAALVLLHASGGS